MTRLDPFPQLSTVDAGGLSNRRSNVKRNSQDLAGHAGPMQPVIHDQSSKLRKKSRGSLRLSRRTWVLPLLLMLTFITLYAINPSESNIFRHFLFLSYKLDDQDDQYGKGPWDFAILCSYTILLTFARGFLMQEVLRPLGRLGGIKSRRKLSRFMEQMYTVYYMGFVGLLGLYTMKRTPGLWYFETRAMYESYPHLSHDAVFKFYYLLQAAFSVQQALIMLLGQEERRKDFQELVAHHAIALALIWISYRYHFTYLGLAVFVSHDITDFCLAVGTITASTIDLCQP
jgi:acyl-CoA-dependent ceramide synthase